MSNKEDTKKENKVQKREVIKKSTDKENNKVVKKKAKRNVSFKEKTLKFLNKAKELIIKYFKIGLRESIKFLKKYKYLIILDIIIFVLTVFIESLYMYKVGKIIWVISTLLFISIPSIVMTAINKVKDKEIIVTIPIFYFLFLVFLNFCTMRDLYGITSGSIDKIPNFIDAMFVVFAFSLIQYLNVKLVCLFKHKRK